jgi:hypothetical protein
MATFCELHSQKYLAFSSAREDSLSWACLREQARHRKIDPTETVALCFGYPKTPCLRAEDKLSTRADKQVKRSFYEIPTNILTPYREFDQRPHTPPTRQLIIKFWVWSQKVISRYLYGSDLGAVKKLNFRQSLLHEGSHHVITDNT